jgi:formiminotetrahydrofolate cyclodeaminase
MSDSASADPKTSLSTTVGTFAELVAAGTPTPGGGSVSAYCGVLAASLGQMVCNLTMGKPKYAAAEPRLTAVRAELERIGARLRELISDDAQSFEGVLLAYRLPKESEEQKAYRTAQIQLALTGAVNVPSETAHRSFEVLQFLDELADIGNANALSDIAVGAQLAQTAVRGASYNVAVNLDSMTDSKLAGEMRDDIEGLLERSKVLADRVEGKLKK